MSEPGMHGMDGHPPMDPESNWDICPVCVPWLAEQDDFPGFLAMSAHHRAHKEGGSAHGPEQGVGRMNEEIEALRTALNELGFERIDARDPSAPIAVKHFADGDLEVTIHFEAKGTEKADWREVTDG